MDNQFTHSAIEQLHAVAGLEPIFKKVQVLQRLQTLLITTEPSLMHDCTVANWEQGCLVIAAKNAAWGAKIRYMIPELLKRLISYPEFTGLTTIRCIVAPHETAHKAKPHAKLSTKTTQLLTQTAKHIADENLKKALIRLAKNT